MHDGSGLEVWRALINRRLLGYTHMLVHPHTHMHRGTQKYYAYSNTDT